MAGKGSTISGVTHLPLVLMELECPHHRHHPLEALVGAQGCFPAAPSLARTEGARVYSGKVKSLKLHKDCSAALFSKALVLI